MRHAHKLVLDLDTHTHRSLNYLPTAAMDNKWNIKCTHAHTHTHTHTQWTLHKGLLMESPRHNTTHARTHTREKMADRRRLTLHDNTVTPSGLHGHYNRTENGKRKHTHTHRHNKKH